MAFGRVKRTRKGRFELRIPAAERDVLRSLPGLLRTLLSEGDTDDVALRRLFPPAYMDDADASAEFDEVVRGDLLSDRLAAIETMERTLDARDVSEDELVAWLAAVNDLRLVLGVRLAVTEESEPADFAGDEDTERSHALYVYLSYLEEDVIAALSAG